MENNTRNYKGKDVEMLTVCNTIIENAITHKTFLQSKRTTWADPFFQDIELRIKAAFNNHLGIDNAAQMRQSTQTLLALQTDVLPKLSEFKVQVNEDFKNPRKTEILTILGFTAHHKAAQRKDQEALIELLTKFKHNLTAALNAELATKGIAPALILSITASADTLRDSNITQETFKSNRPNISAAAVTEFNQIYEQVISIAKISRKFFATNKPIADQFSYTKILKALNTSPHPSNDPPPPTP